MEILGIIELNKRKIKIFFLKIYNNIICIIFYVIYKKISSAKNF